MTLKAYLQSKFSNVGNQLSYVDATYDTIVDDAVELYGVSTEADATDLKKLHALGVFAFWTQILADVSLDYNFSADGSSFSRSQMYDMANKNLLLSRQSAMQYLPNYQITLGELSTQEDPYIYIFPGDLA